MVEDLRKRGLYALGKEAADSLKQLREEYSGNVSLDSVRQITGRVYKKHRKTLSQEVAYIRSS